MGRGVRVLHMSDRRTRSVERPRTERAQVSGNNDIERKAQAAGWQRVQREIAKEPRVCSKWVAGDDPTARRVDARCDEVLERQEAHHRCRPG